MEWPNFTISRIFKTRPTVCSITIGIKNCLLQDVWIPFDSLEITLIEKKLDISLISNKKRLSWERNLRL